MPDQPRTAEDVKALVQERDIRFIRFWFTDILGPAEVVLDQRGRARRRVRGGDGLRRLLDHRLQRDRGVGHDRDARPEHLRGAAVAPGGAGGGADVLRRDHARAHALRGRSRATSCAARSSARQSMGFDTFNVGPELEYFLFRDSRSTEVLDEGGYFDLTTLDAGSDVRRETVLALEELGHPRRVHPSRGRSLPARDRHALRGRAEDGRRLHDVPHHGQGVRDEVRLARDVHAQAAVRRERLGHAHAPVAVQRRPERLLRRRRPVLPLRRGQGLHRRAAQARARDLLDLRAVGQLLQAPRARLRGARIRRLVAPQPLGARAGAALPPGRARGPRAWSCAARTRRATHT